MRAFDLTQIGSPPHFSARLTLVVRPQFRSATEVVDGDDFQTILVADRLTRDDAITESSDAGSLTSSFRMT